MRKKRSLKQWGKSVLVWGIVSLFSCVPLKAIDSAEEKPPAKSMVKLEKHLGKRVVTILTGATKVGAFRVDPKAQDDWANGTPIELDKDSAIGMSAALLKDEAYAWEGNEPMRIRCYFQPHIAYRFWKEKEYVSVLICFGCSQILFVADTPGDKDERFFGVFGPEASPEIFRLSKEAFPADGLIRFWEESTKERTRPR
ncbi:MAG TPA: hypothetical protein VF719_11930 [Abditibacteriaceae bacterium]|jgi:hypothetical protein